MPHLGQPATRVLAFCDNASTTRAFKVMCRVGDMPRCELEGLVILADFSGIQKSHVAESEARFRGAPCLPTSHRQR